MYSIRVMFGSTVSGFVIALVNPFRSLFIISGLLAVTLVCQYAIKVKETVQLQKLSFEIVLSDTKDGIRYIFSQKPVLNILLVFLVSNLADNGITPVLIYHLKHNLGLSSEKIGLTLAAGGIGLFVGSILALKFKKFPSGKVIFFFLLVNNVGISLYLLHDWCFIVLAQFTLYLGGVVSNIIKSVVIQTIVPNEMLGRVAGGMRIMEQGTQPISLALLGWIAAEHGSYSAFITMFALSLITTVVMLITRLIHIDIREKECSDSEVA